MPMPMPMPMCAAACRALQNLRLYREAAAVLMEAGDHEGLIAACQRYGDARAGWFWFCGAG